MTTHPIVAHERLRRELGQALSQGRIPNVLLITGETGVGKQRLGLWLAQLALCTSPQGAEPCGACGACHRVLELGHPDLHWFIPVPRPKAGEPDKQVEEVKEALGEILAERRVSSIYAAPDGMSNHGIATARLILRTAALTAVEGGWRVFLIGDAERLVPQEANPDAANALLKFLEEPPAKTLVILTTPDASKVLPTIRSRAVQVRVGRIPSAAIEQALAHLAPKLSAAERQARAVRSEGSLGRALTQGAERAVTARVEELLAVAKQGGPERFERAFQQPPWQARGEFADLLDQLAETLCDAAKGAAGSPTSPIPSVLASIGSPDRFLRSLDHVEKARELARGNVNPQLVLANLTRDLGDELWR